MKKKFSKHWKASSQPRKQRKYAANAPLHIKRKLVSVNLSKDLRKKFGKRNIPIKKNDKVKIKRGKFKGKEGKVLEVNLKKSKIIIEGIQTKKMDGSKVNVKMQPSNLQIIELTERKNKKESNKKNEPENKK
ncbi:MAG TPA: 50S ribosomal protein L24 [Candidatus Pacearchaeota archaeon]|nr:50S ribosomal protein L24 [Candidatus Pacearchaeota archaeon]